MHFLNKNLFKLKSNIMKTYRHKLKKNQTIIHKENKENDGTQI
jgi:hypothetical protein